MRSQRLCTGHFYICCAVAIVARYPATLYSARSSLCSCNLASSSGLLIEMSCASLAHRVYLGHGEYILRASRPRELMNVTRRHCHFKHHRLWSLCQGQCTFELLLYATPLPFAWLISSNFCMHVRHLRNASALLVNSQCHPRSGLVSIRSMTTYQTCLTIMISAWY